MNEILVARKAFAETLTSSAVARSVQMYGVPASSRGAYTWRRVASAVADVTPATSRSGRRVSCTAKPSRRNSGFHASSASGPFDHRLDGAGVGGQRAGQLGRPHADEMHLAEPGRISQGAAEAQRARSKPASQQLVQSWLEERRPALRQHADPARVRVHPEHIVADRGHARGMHSAQVSSADDADAHDAPLLV